MSRCARLGLVVTVGALCALPSAAIAASTGDHAGQVRAHAVAHTAPPVAPLTPATSFATVSYPVSFSVTDTDTTSLVKLNPGDGKTYTVTGHITAPAGALDAGSPATTLYMPGLGYGEWFWRFTAVPGYNYADAEAARGLTSVTVDKLGYGASGIPDGNDVGYGTEATVDHQIIQDLRDGNYTLDGHSAVKFTKVALGAQSQAVLAAELEEDTYKDADALVFTNWDDAAVSPSLLENYSINVANCESDPLNEGGPGTPGGYQYRERSAAMFIQDDFPGAAPAVTAAAAQLHAKDPCGYPAFSVEPTFGEANLLTALSLHVPVISVIGGNDAELLPQEAVAHQTAEFAADPDATSELLAGAPQAITLGQSYRQYQAINAGFLCQNGYGYDNCVAPARSTATGSTPGAKKHHASKKHRKTKAKRHHKTARRHATKQHHAATKRHRA